MIALMRWLGQVVITLLVASFLIFAAMYLAPGDPATVLAGGAENASEETLAAIRAEYHLDQPFLVQYVLWLGGVVRGDLGRSFVYGQDVGFLIATRLETTVWLALYAAVLTIAIGVLLGSLSAVRRGPLDSMVSAATAMLAGIPPFVAAVGLIAAFGVGLAWFPVTGAGEGVLGRLHHLTLPAVSLAVVSLATITRVTRQSMVDILVQDHVRVARTRGIPERLVIGRHVLRNAVGPIATMAGMITASLLAGTVVVESVFGLSGVGSLLVNAINTKDFPVTQAVLLCMVLAYVVTTGLTELVQHLADPRLRRARRAGVPRQAGAAA
ncbi:ABC transporter permease [Saccharopolyspora sp. 5N102]|uniref:ABC transporter permease n=1 Tax=Saccharopolyspora sp. 5N102 TaxID=3375155 RepID=UPI0037BB2A68